jgi:hypothetical protein
VYPDQSTCQSFVYILNLLNGEEETPEDLSTATVWGSAEMMDVLKAKVDKAYRSSCEMMTGKPFEWEHDEALYQKTLSAENLANFVVIPGVFPNHNGVFIYIDAYFPGSEQPEQMRITLTLIPWYNMSTWEYVDLRVLKAYPGLEKWIEGYNGKREIASYLSFGAWEYGNEVIIGLGRFDEDGQWAGYEAISINTETGRISDWEQMLLYAGTTKEAFEYELRTYLEALRAEM